MFASKLDLVTSFPLTVASFVATFVVMTVKLGEALLDIVTGVTVVVFPRCKLDITEFCAAVVLIKLTWAFPILLALHVKSFALFFMTVVCELLIITVGCFMEDAGRTFLEELTSFIIGCDMDFELSLLVVPVLEIC